MSNKPPIPSGNPDNFIGLADDSGEPIPKPKPAAGGNKPPNKPPVKIATGGPDDNDETKGPANGGIPIELEENTPPPAKPASGHAAKIPPKTLVALTPLEKLVQKKIKAAFPEDDISIKRVAAKTPEGNKIVYQLTVPRLFERESLAKVGFGDTEVENFKRINNGRTSAIYIPEEAFHEKMGIKASVPNR